MEPLKDNLSPSNLMDRMTSPTPPFWQKVRNLAIAVVAIAGSIVVLAPTAPFTIPAAIITVAQYVAFGGAVAGLGAQMTKTDSPSAPIPPEGK